MNKLSTLYVICILLLLGSCTLGGNRTWQDEKIDPELKKTIGKLNEEVFAAINEKDPSKIEKIMSVELKEVFGGEMREIIKGEDIKYFRNAKYEVFHEFYTSNTTTGLTNFHRIPANENNFYQISYKASCKKMYVSMIQPVLEDGSKDLLITIIYGKYSEGWRIFGLNFGVYLVNGKNAAEIYELAEQLYKEGKKIDAVNWMSMAKRVLTPSGNYGHFDNEKEINEFGEKIFTELNGMYSFPIEVKIPTKPQILGVSPELYPEGVLPAILYTTQIDLKDTIALKNEHEAMKEVITDIFPDIRSNGSYVFYLAYNEMPAEGVNRYRFVEKLKK